MKWKPWKHLSDDAPMTSQDVLTSQGDIYGSREYSVYEHFFFSRTETKQKWKTKTFFFIIHIQFSFWLFICKMKFFYPSAVGFRIHQITSYVRTKWFFIFSPWRPWPLATFALWFDLDYDFNSDFDLNDKVCSRRSCNILSLPQMSLLIYEGWYIGCS